MYPLGYIPGVTHQQWKNGLKIKIYIKKSQCKQTSSRILQLNRWFVSSSIFYEIEPLELGDKMSLDHVAPICPLQLQSFMTSIPSVN